MGIKSSLPKTLVIWTCLLGVCLAEPVWFAFWSSQPVNLSSINKVNDLLQQDAAQVNGGPAVKKIGADFLDGGKQSATFYWWAKIDRSKITEQAYKELLKEDLSDIIDIEDLIVRENPDKGKPGLPPDEDILKGNPLPTTSTGGILSAQAAFSRLWRGRTKRVNLKTQEDAPRQLRFISLPQDQNNDLVRNTDYVYDENAGKGARVYVVDSGLNFESSEWESDGGRETPQIMYAGIGNKQEPKDVDTAIGHGTCMADIAVGRKNGVAKEADLTAVQFDIDTFKANVVTLPEAVLEAMTHVMDNIHRRKTSKNFVGEKHVVSMSFSVFDRGRPSDQTFRDGFFQILKDLDNLGVGLVVSMPNEAKCNKVPCGYGLNETEKYPFLPNLILVGNARIDTGQYSDDLDDIDDLDKFTIFGPGNDQVDGGRANPGIICADSTGDQSRSEARQQGTSHATAFTAGLMAYHMGNGLDRDAARKLILDTAYARAQDGPKIIYNAVK